MRQAPFRMSHIPRRLLLECLVHWYVFEDLGLFDTDVWDFQQLLWFQMVMNCESQTFPKEGEENNWVDPGFCIQDPGS